MFKLLAVGNSFSQDALYYLHDIAQADGVDVLAVNLYIGGCSLERHWNNILGAKEDYLYEVNGVSTGRYVSANSALHEVAWDVIMTQQASHDSGLQETYFPYLELLVDHFKNAVPNAKCVLQKTWAYELDSTHDKFSRYQCSQSRMYAELSKCYDYASRKARVPLIPCGDVVQAVRGKHPFRYELGERSLCRDGFHMDKVYGRFLLAATIYTSLFKRISCAIHSSRMERIGKRFK